MADDKKRRRGLSFLEDDELRTDQILKGGSLGYFDGKLGAAVDDEIRSGLTFLQDDDVTPVTPVRLLRMWRQRWLRSLLSPLV